MVFHEVFSHKNFHHLATLWAIRLYLRSLPVMAVRNKIKITENRVKQAKAILYVIKVLNKCLQMSMPLDRSWPTPLVYYIQLNRFIPSTGEKKRDKRGDSVKIHLVAINTSVNRYAMPSFNFKLLVLLCFVTTYILFGFYAWVTLTGGNWQKWKRVFLTCPCHEIYRDEAVGLKSCKNTWKITIFVKMWNLGQIMKIWYFVNNCLIRPKAWI